MIEKKKSITRIIYCPHCGFEHELMNPLLNFCRNCGLDVRNRIEELRKNKVKNHKISPDKNRMKKCGRCGEIKPINQFFQRSNGKVSWGCKECKNEYSIIRKAVLKYRLAAAIQSKTLQNEDINTNKYDIINCKRCGILLYEIPYLEFHHLRDKKISWGELKSYGYKRALKLILSEEIEILCRNCHCDVTADLFNLYIDIIFKIKLHGKSGDELDDLLNKFLPKSKSYYLKYNLKSWLIKKYVINTFFGGECALCGLTTYENLPALDFHHLDPEIKEYKWNELYSLNIRDTLEKLAKEKCICVCSNCHVIIHSRFFEFVEEIYEKIDEKHFGSSTLQNYLKKVKDMQNYFNHKIKAFKPIKIRKIDPELLNIDLRVRFNSENVLENFMLAIKEIIIQNGFNEFKLKQLQEIVNKAIRTIQSHIYEKLIPIGIVKEKSIPLHLKSTTSEKIYKLTKNGFKYLQKLGVDANFIRSSLNSSRINIFAKNLIELYKFVENKNLNEFYEKEIWEIIDLPDKKKIIKKEKYISNFIYRELLRKNLIDYVNNPLTRNIRWNVKVFKFTDKALEIIDYLLKISRPNIY